MNDIGRRTVVLRTMADIAAGMVAQGDWGDEYVAEATAFAQRLSEEALALEAPRSPETVLRAIEEAAIKADNLARRKQAGGLDVAKNRALGRAEGLRDAARIVAEATAPSPAEPTPVVVLRAMLKAYDAHSEALGVRFFRATEYDARAWAAYGKARSLAEIVRQCLHFAVAGNSNPMAYEPDVLVRDYEARLSGAKPLDALPEET